MVEKKDTNIKIVVSKSVTSYFKRLVQVRILGPESDPPHEVKLQPLSAIENRVDVVIFGKNPLPC